MPLERRPERPNRRDCRLDILSSWSRVRGEPGRPGQGGKAKVQGKASESTAEQGKGLGDVGRTGHGSLEVLMLLAAIGVAGGVLPS